MFGVLNKNMQKETRKAARTVIFDKNTDKIAVVEVKNGIFHKIPGGGIEVGETPKEAALREAVEEGASDVELITELGESGFYDPEDFNLFHHSVCFLAKKIKDHKVPDFTDEEVGDNFKLLWLTFDEAIRLFESVQSKVMRELEMNNRDLQFVKMAQEYLAKNS